MIQFIPTIGGGRKVMKDNICAGYLTKNGDFTSSRKLGSIIQIKDENGNVVSEKRLVFSEEDLKIIDEYYVTDKRA